MSSATRPAQAAIATTLTFAVLAFTASSAGAFSLRVPQVVFQNAALQTYLNTMDGGINTTTDQVDAQIFSTGYTGNTDFTLMVKSTSEATLGIYNSMDAASPPTLFELFSGSALEGYAVACHFDGAGGLTVNKLDDMGNPIGSVSYSGVDQNHFGFYLQTSAGTVYSQDGRNGGLPQVLTYAGTGINFGDWFICFEGMQYLSTKSTFNTAIMFLQAVVPTPTRTTSWGALKATYR